MTPPVSFGSALLAGVIGGALFVGVAYLLRPFTRPILAYVLILVAFAYVIFAAVAGQSAGWLALELLGVGIYGTLAILGLRGSAWWLAAAWALHPLWDIALHYVGPGAAFAPVWWTVPCLSWDLVTAAYIAVRAARGTHPFATLL